MSEGAEEGSKDRPGGRPGRGEEKVRKDRCQNWPKRGSKDRCLNLPKREARTDVKPKKGARRS